MSLLNNYATYSLVHGLFRITSRCEIDGRHHLPPPGSPAVLAVAHLSHYDPVCVGALLRRQIDWMARAEFYESPGARWAVRNAGCVKIDRYGSALPGIREGLDRLAQHRLLGIFPDGEIMQGQNSVLNGASIKAGAVLLSRRAGVPIVPCVVLGSDQFRRVTPWLPLRKGRLWISLGPALPPPGPGDELAQPGRASRAAMSHRLAEAIRAVYQQMQQRHDIPDEVKP